jgi:hypothetical protein
MDLVLEVALVYELATGSNELPDFGELPLLVLEAAELQDSSARPCPSPVAIKFRVPACRQSTSFVTFGPSIGLA